MHVRNLCLCPSCIQAEIARDYWRDQDERALDAGCRRKGPPPVELAQGVVRRARQAA